MKFSTIFLLACQFMQTLLFEPANTWSLFPGLNNAPVATKGATTPLTSSTQKLNNTSPTVMSTTIKSASLSTKLASTTTSTRQFSSSKTSNTAGTTKTPPSKSSSSTNSAPSTLRSSTMSPSTTRTYPFTTSESTITQSLIKSLATTDATISIKLTIPALGSTGGSATITQTNTAAATPSTTTTTTHKSTISQTPSPSSTAITSDVKPQTSRTSTISTGTQPGSKMTINPASTQISTSMNSASQTTSKPSGTSRSDLETIRTTTTGYPIRTIKPDNLFEIVVNGTLTCDGDVTLPNGTKIVKAGVLPSAVYNHSSPQFAALSSVMSTAIAEIFTGTGANVVSIHITEFRQGSIISDYVTALTALTQMTPDAIFEAVSKKFNLMATVTNATYVTGTISLLKSNTVNNVAVIRQPATNAASSSFSCQDDVFYFLLVSFLLWHLMNEER